MDKRDYELLFRAIKEVDRFVYRMKKKSQAKLSKYSPMDLYNMWVYTSGFSVRNVDDTLYLIEHIAAFRMMPLSLMEATMRIDGTL